VANERQAHERHEESLWGRPWGAGNRVGLNSLYRFFTSDSYGPMVHNSWISRMDRAKILKAYIPPIMKVEDGVLEDDFSLQRGPLFTSIVFFWKKTCLYVKIHLKLNYICIWSRFRVLFPTPPAITNDIQQASPGFPPRGGWPWSRVPWIGRGRHGHSNFGPRKNWMDQIQGWLKKHKKKGWYPPKFQCSFFSCFFF